LQLRMQFYSLTGTLLTTATSSATSITTSWARLTCAATAPAGAAFAILSIATTATTTAATTVRTTAWQLEQAAAATSWASSGSWSQLWQGFVERWAQSYDQNGKYGMVDVTCVDALAPLSQLTYQDVMPGWLVQTQSASLQAAYSLATPGSSPDVPGGSAS